MNIKKGDFVRLDYTARITPTKQVVDTTKLDVAKDNKIYNAEAKYEPMTLIIGEGSIFKAIDTFLEGKEEGTYSLDLTAENAFGKKNAKLLRLVSLKEFHKHQIQPVPGLQINLDDSMGTVRVVNGGRVMVDFNHPLASQDLTYEMTINKIIIDEKEKLEAVLKILRLPYKEAKLEEGKAVIKFETEIPEEIKGPIIDEIKKYITAKDVEFVK